LKQVREWKKLLQPYEQAVEEIKVKFKYVRKQYRDLNEYSPIEFVTGRVKSISSILEKCKRRGIPEDKIEDLMEDIAGIRVMCQFTDDIYKVVEHLESRNGKDFTIVYEKDYINNPKESGYKSYHVIIKYPVQTAYGERDILAELQIRTLAMNFWATIEHSLNYKYDMNIPDEMRERLRKAALAASSLDEEMCEIRKDVINAQLMFEQKSNVTYDIIDSIKLLVHNNMRDEAIEYQERFEKIWDSGSANELEALLEDIKSKLPVYSIFRKG
jgi:putative GTP pyrophosphokinase